VPGTDRSYSSRSGRVRLTSCDGAWHRPGYGSRSAGGRLTAAYGLVTGARTADVRVRFVGFRVRSGYDRAAASALAFFFAGDGLIRTTSQVMAAASEITHAMKTMMPMIPSTFATEVG
jgi:hypothetical protein